MPPLSLVKAALEPPTPTAFGPYGVEGVLGQGTMGVVFRARHQTLGRLVAIKSLHPWLLSDATLVRRFLQEAKLVNAINHPHIVEVYDFVEAPGQVYAVMELLEGETLARRLEARPLSLDELLRIAAQVADALKAAHALSVVHRDLKPDNVFLCTRDGADWVKVLDFGVAKLTSTEGPRVIETQNGDVLGTPRYMAPEQAAGLEVDPRTDVYAFGTLLFELLAGKPPFESTVYGQLAADIITRPPPPVPTLTRRGEAVPEGLRHLIGACLAKLPDHRPTSMAQVLERLTHVDEPPESPATRARRWLVPVVTASIMTVAGVYALRSTTSDSADTSAVVQPSAPAAPLEPPAPPAIVNLVLDTIPSGATVYDAATNEALGQTPLSLRRRADAPLSARFELKGYAPLLRHFPTSESLRVELPLVKLTGRSVRRQTRVVTDGVIDPF